jgi:hypothetical protein
MLLHVYYSTLDLVASRLFYHQDLVHGKLLVPCDAIIQRPSICTIVKNSAH